MYVYIYIYTYFLYLYISLEKLKPSINVHVCMHAYMSVWMYGKITNKQSFEWNMYTTWDASLQDFCGRTPWGT